MVLLTPGVPTAQTRLRLSRVSTTRFMQACQKELRDVRQNNALLNSGLQLNHTLQDSHAIAVGNGFNGIVHDGID